MDPVLGSIIGLLGAAVIWGFIGYLYIDHVRKQSMTLSERIAYNLKHHARACACEARQDVMNEAPKIAEVTKELI